MQAFSPFKPLSRLYSLGHIKEVESPRSDLESPRSPKISAYGSNTDILSKSEEEVESFKRGRGGKQQIEEELENSIDDLFDKIQRIKSEFTPNQEITSPLFLQRSQSTQSQQLPYHQDLRNVLEIKDQNRTQPPTSQPLLFKKPSLQSKHSSPAKPPRKVVIEDFELGKTLGSGKFGDVLQCRHKATGTLYAIKKIFKSTIQEYRMVDQLAEQLKIHYSLDHKNIVTLYKHFDDEYHIFLLMEYLDGGVLMELPNREESYISNLIYQTLRALEHLHKRKIAHRDIKPENIILTNGLVKLCDFGWAANCDTGMKKTFCGTLDYVSPQILEQREYSLSVDLWSMGVLTFQLLTGFAPFNQQIPKVKMNKIKNIDKQKLLFPPQITSEAKDFIGRFLRKNPAERMSLREAFDHPFIRNYRRVEG